MSVIAIPSWIANFVNLPDSSLVTWFARSLGVGFDGTTTAKKVQEFSQQQSTVNNNQQQSTTINNSRSKTTITKVMSCIIPPLMKYHVGIS